MRIMVFFDLPTETMNDKREYRKFRSFLVKKGFLMMQESVYCKLALNQTSSTAIVKSLRDNKPAKGLVQIMIVTEKQFSRMEYLCGEKVSSVLDSDERLVIL
jgi:CRISPR-associated protein Cas2